MLSAAGSKLVAWGTVSNAMDNPIKVKVARAFYFKSELQPVGSVVILPAAVAHEVLGMGKAVPYTAPPPKVEKAEAKAPDVKEKK